MRNILWWKSFPLLPPKSIGQNGVARWRNGVFPYLQEEEAVQVSSHFLLHWNPLVHSRPSLFIEWITNEEYVELGFVRDSEIPSHTIRERGKHVEPVAFHWWALSPRRSLLSSIAAPQTFCRPKFNWFILFSSVMCFFSNYIVPFLHHPSVSESLSGTVKKGREKGIYLLYMVYGVRDVWLLGLSS